MSLRAAALQLTSTTGDVEANLDHLEEAIAALPAGVDLAVAPELYTTGYDLEMIASKGHRLGEPVEGPGIRRIRAMAQRAGITLAVGFLETDGEVLYDSVLVTRSGAVPTVYRKTHLYPAEQSVFAPGESLVVLDGGQGARLGMMICFEHAFPDIATALAIEGSQILVIPSAVPVGYEHVLSLRTRARAQDNQVFAIGCNMPKPFCGESLIVDPRGEVLGKAGIDEEVIVADLDLDAVASERAREPSLDLRRPELYR